MINAITCDGANNLYVTGKTAGGTFPVMSFGGGAYDQTTYGGGAFDAFLTKFGSGGGGYGMFGGNTASAQGYSMPVFVLDAALKWSFMKEKAASLTLNVSDVLKSKINITHTESNFFVQDVSRKRDQFFFRLNFNYRFGKFDVSIFKRKNMKMNTDGMQDMGM